MNLNRQRLLAETSIRELYETQRQIPNLGVLLHPKGGSHLVCVDVDGHDERATEKLKTLGVSRRDAAWRQITGKRNGHFHIFYFWSGEPLPRIADQPDGLPVDLLSNGYAVIAPSDTSLEAGGGGPYQWVRGHSPFDISVVDLEPPPDPLIEWWHQRAHPSAPSWNTEARQPPNLKAWALVNSNIPVGKRNGSLTRIAGLLRLYHPPAVVESLLLAINDARCDPPLEADEVRGIVRSVCRYPQPGVNGHPKALVNPWRSRDSD